MERSNIKKSKRIYDRAVKVLTGGVSRNTIFRNPHPCYVKSVNGSYITDVDDNIRIDFANNMASLIHGHAHPEITNAVKEQLKNGSSRFSFWSTCLCRRFFLNSVFTRYI